MAWFHGGVACPKPAKTRKQVKGTKDRREAKVKKSVRALCVERDGYCRLLTRPLADIRDYWSACGGSSHWAHLGEKKRFKTRNQDAETRHTKWGSLILCCTHHEDYDRARMRITILTPFGADGPLRFSGSGVRSSGTMTASS